MAGSSFLPTDLGREDNVEVGHPRAGALQWHPTRFNFPNLERGVENHFKLQEIPSDLASAYVKRHLPGRARDWYEIFGYNSYDNPTPLAHADASRDVFPRGGTSQWRPTRFNLYDPEMRNARGFNVWSEVYFSGSENVTEFL
ncbi:uncharacterized protein TNCV_2706221 [Trichonephila clavipes]|nr:uncharacterized protein TNCV_2706221 [Trichonephila clavipes]